MMAIGPPLPTCAVHKSGQLSEVLGTYDRTAAIAVFDPMYGPAVRCRRFRRSGGFAVLQRKFRDVRVMSEVQRRIARSSNSR
jgi:hypothetical protein